MSELLKIIVSGDDRVTADEVRELVIDGPRPYRIVTNPYVLHRHAYIQAIHADRIECGTSDGTVHAVIALDSIRSIGRS